MTGAIARSAGAGLRAVVALALVALVAPVVPADPAAASAPSGPRVVFHLQDPRIDEASGIGVGVRSRGIDYIENDSGDANRFFALNAHTGATAAVVTVPHATNVDWEDLQVAPAPDGTSSVWLADIGDNAAMRSEIEIYRVPEPRVDPHDTDEVIRSARPAIWRLRYPSGPTDAESLAVTPHGHAYIVTKNVLGESGVYLVPREPDPHRVRELTRVATIGFAAAPGRSPVGSLGSVLATSASISHNGRLLAVRTYVYADVWRLDPRPGDDGVVAALGTPPTRVTLPAQRQGEGIAFAHGALLLDSEGIRTPVWSVPLPPSLRGGRAGITTQSPAPASTGSSAGAGSGRPAPSPSRTAPGSSSGRFGGLSVLILVLLIGGAVVLGRRARRFGDDGTR